MVTRMILVVLACAATIGGAVTSAQQYLFLRSAQVGTATVESVESRNDSCRRNGGSSRSRYRRSTAYDCTKFSAKLTFFTPDGRPVSFFRSAGSVPGHNVSIGRASYRTAQQFEVYYDPADPREAVIDSWGDKWGLSVILVGVGLILLAASVAPGSRY